jgi:hypothetical protein
MPALRSFRLLAAPLALLVLVGCSGVTPINELLANPSKYEGETVRIEGEVTGGVGALGVGGYQVRDETGTLTVISEVGNAPATGTRIRVEGSFQSLLTIGTRSLAVLRERSRDAR